MSEIYSIEGTQESKARECCPFDIQEKDMFSGYSTYNEVLRIFREAFKMVDITKIIGKS